MSENLISQPPGPVSIADELAAIREELKNQSLQLDYAQKYQRVLGGLQDLKNDVDEKWRYFKLATIVVSALLSLGGIMGIKTLSDAKTLLHEQIAQSIKESRQSLEQDARQTREFYTDLMAGSTLFVRKQYAAAVPRLLKCFPGHEYDKSVLIPLLSALNLADDWDNAKPVIGTLLSNLAKFDALNDKFVYMITGSMEVQMGITDLGEGNGAQGQASAHMEAGFDLLNRAYGLTRNDLETRKHILTNYWLYYLTKRNFAEAVKTVQELQKLPRDVRVYSWKDVSHWKCVLALRKKAEKEHTDTMSIAEKQWRALSSKYLPDGY